MAIFNCSNQICNHLSAVTKIPCPVKEVYVMTQAPVAHLQSGSFSLALTSVSPVPLFLLAN